MFWYLVIILIIIFIIGIIGFMYFFDTDLIDSTYQTAIMTSTLGLANTTIAATDAQKFFIGVYSLISAILFIGIGTHLVSEIIRIYDEKLEEREKVSYKDTSDFLSG